MIDVMEEVSPHELGCIFKLLGTESFTFTAFTEYENSIVGLAQYVCTMHDVFGQRVMRDKIPMTLTFPDEYVYEEFCKIKSIIKNPTNPDEE